MMSAAHKSESPGGAGQVATQNTNNVVEFRTAFDSDKGLSLLKDRLAKAGHRVHDGSNRDFIVCSRWGHTKHLPDRAALTLFARIVGVAG